MKTPTKKQVQKYFQELEKIETEYRRKEYLLEQKMAKETGIKDIEFFWCDNSIVGIGNTSRTLKLIQRH